MEFEFSSLEKFFILFIARFILHGVILNKFRKDVRTQGNTACMYIKHYSLLK